MSCDVRECGSSGCSTSEPHWRDGGSLWRNRSTAQSRPAQRAGSFQSTRRSLVCLWFSALASKGAMPDSHGGKLSGIARVGFRRGKRIAIAGKCYTPPSSGLGRRVRFLVVDVGCLTSTESRPICSDELRWSADGSSISGVGQHHSDVRQEDRTADQHPAQRSAGHDGEHKADRADPHRQ